MPGLYGYPNPTQQGMTEAHSREEQEDRHEFFQREGVRYGHNHHHGQLACRDVDKRGNANSSKPIPVGGGCRGGGGGVGGGVSGVGGGRGGGGGGDGGGDGSGVGGVGGVGVGGVGGVGSGVAVVVGGDVGGVRDDWRSTVGMPEMAATARKGIGAGTAGTCGAIAELFRGGSLSPV